LKRVPGQNHALHSLRALLRSGRLPHALLFLGADGTGRREVARELARALLCQGDAEPDDSCGQCESCRLIDKDRHPDYDVVGVPEGKQALPIATVLEVQHKAWLKPSLGNGRVFVVCDADHMSPEAANCFLKTLEEPPAGCVLVLIAASRRQLPETIVSRCRMVRFRNLPPDVLQQELERDDTPADEAGWLAQRTWGSPGAARQFRDMKLHALNREMANALCKLSLEDNFRLSDWLSGKAAALGRSATEVRTALQEMLECAVLHYRDLALAAAVGADAADLRNPALADRITELARGRDPDFFLDQANRVLDAMEHIAANANRPIALDHLFTQLALARRGAR